MSLITLLIAVLIVGFLVWIISSAPIPIHPWFKNVIVGIVVIFFVIWLLNFFGLNTGINLRL